MQQAQFAWLNVRKSGKQHLFHIHIFQLFWEDSTVLPGLAKRRSLQHVLSLLHGLLPVRHACKNSPRRHPGGREIWRSTGSTPVLSRIIKVLTQFILVVQKPFGCKLNFHWNSDKSINHTDWSMQSGLMDGLMTLTQYQIQVWCQY